MSCGVCKLLSMVNRTIKYLVCCMHVCMCIYVCVYLCVGVCVGSCVYGQHH